MADPLSDAERAFARQQNENGAHERPPRRHSCERTAAHYCASFSSARVVARLRDASIEAMQEWLERPSHLLHVMALDEVTLVHAFVLHRRRTGVVLVTSSYGGQRASQVMRDGVGGWVPPWTDERPGELDVACVGEAMRSGRIADINDGAWPLRPRYVVTVFAHDPTRDRAQSFDLQHSPMHTLHVLRQVVMLQILWSVTSVRYATLFLTAAATFKLRREADPFDHELARSDYSVNMADVFPPPPPTTGVELAERLCAAGGASCRAARLDQIDFDDDAAVWIAEPRRAVASCAAADCSASSAGAPAIGRSKRVGRRRPASPAGRTWRSLLPGSDLARDRRCVSPQASGLAEVGKVLVL